MNFVHPKSLECSKSELDLFLVPPTQTSLERGHWVEYQPVSSVADGGPITFLVPGTKDYADLSKTLIVLRAKVTKANGDDLDADEKVGIVNNFLHTLFKQVDVFLKEKQVTQASGTYAYRAYIETLLNYGPDAKKSQLTAAMFYKDQAGNMDVADPTIAVTANANAGLKARYDFNKESGTIEMTGPLFCDIFMTERLLLSFVDLKVVLSRNNKEFCLMASQNDVDYRVKITDAYLKIRKVKVSSSISVAHETALKRGPAIYPIRRVECKSFIVAGGNPSLRKDNVFNGLVPKTFVFGLVDSDAFNGDYKKNPYNFKNFTVSYVGISANGQEIPFRPLKLSYANNKFIEAYHTLFSGTGKMNYDVGNDISREEYPNGYTLYAFDLTPDMCGRLLILMSCKKEISLLTSSSPPRQQMLRVLCVTENLKTLFTLTLTEMSSTITPDEYK